MSRCLSVGADMSTEAFVVQHIDSKKKNFVKPKYVTGLNLRFRRVDVNDAAFILNLRLDEKKSRHLSSTSADLAQQIKWLESCVQDDSQIYFIIENKLAEQFGTVRLYDRREDSFCWGSWILKEGCPAGFSVESALIVYEFALSLGFSRAHFDVRKQNVSVWRFHEKFGAKRVGETENDYLYEIDHSAISRSLQKYKRFLPDGIHIHF